MMFFPIVGVLKSLLIIFATGCIAYAMGYINEKLSDESILPSFIIHSVSNLVAGLHVAFFLKKLVRHRLRVFSSLCLFV
mgnify:FL=1